MTHGETTQGAAVGPSADVGKRIISYLIDLAMIVVALVVAGTIGQVLGQSTVARILGFIFLIGLSVLWFWNYIYKQGTTGQTVGMGSQGTKLVADATGRPVGIKKCLIRYVFLYMVSLVTCGVFGIVDRLWVLFTPEKKRLIDKILDLSVVDA